ncbi:MAG: hypothetical protein AAF847_17975 [Bacteroidota bacterium]
MLHIPLPFIDSYFDPFACAVLGLAAIQFERVILWRSSNFKLTWYEIVGVVIFLAFISEYLFPLLSDRFVRDFYDVLAYAAGGIYFYFFEQCAKKYTN